jgi:hypothetical protein
MGSRAGSRPWLRRWPGVASLAAPPDRGSLHGMMISPNPYLGFRFPPEVIEHAVWPPARPRRALGRRSHCFSLSLRDLELILAARGIVVSYESIREWGLRIGRIFANMLKRAASHYRATSGTCFASDKPT